MSGFEELPGVPEAKRALLRGWTASGSVACLLALLSLAPARIGAASEANPCVDDVQRRFAAVSRRASMIKAWSVVGRDDAVYDHRADNRAALVLGHKLRVPGRGSWQMVPNQLSDHGERCHIQGVQRLTVGQHLAVVYNATDGSAKSTTIAGIGAGNDCEENRADWGGAHLAIIRLGSSRAGPTARFGANVPTADGDPPSIDRVVFDVDMNASYWHPSGVQMVGDVLAVGLYRGDSDERRSVVQFWDLSKPAAPAHFASLTVVGRKVETVGITDLGYSYYSGTRSWLLALGSSRSSIIDFYQVSGRSLREVARRFAERPPTTWDRRRDGFTGSGFDHDNYQAINLVKECSKSRLVQVGALYLVGTSKTGKDALLGRGDPVAHLYQLDYQAGNHARLRKVASRTFDCQGHCNFDAGGGLYLRNDRIAIYGTNHYVNKRDAFDAGVQDTSAGPAQVKARWVVFKLGELW